MSILKIVEHFNNIDLSFLNKKADISFLKPYKDKKILMIGYNHTETNLNSLPDFDIEAINKNINKYDLFVISNKINFQTRKKIKNILDLFSKKNKDYIFYGYTSYLNLNLDNSKNMFRPIDIRKEPFNIKNFKKLNTSPYYYYLIQYICLTIFTLYLNIKFNKLLYRFLAVIVLLFALFIPFKNILYIRNNVKV